MPSPIFLPDFLASIHALNAWRGARVLRDYQLRILRGPDLQVVSPFDGQSCVVEESLLLASDVIAYRFGGGRFHLLVGAQHEGYPLDRLLDVDARTAWRLPLDPGGAMQPDGDESRIGELARRIEELGNSDCDERRHVLFGDGNFAHLVWNGWAALAALPDVGISMLHRAHFVSRCDPLGDPRAAFPWLAGLPLTGWDERSDLHQGRRFRAAVLLGAAHMSAELVDIVRRVCDARADAELQQACRQLRGEQRRVVWISLRRRARDCLNQVAFLAALIERLARQPHIALILDGFSYPDCPLPDFFHDYRTRVDDAYAQLLAASPALRAMQDSGRALLLNGCPIFDAISAAAHADFYVCHGGTQQHKIAWFHRVPGVIHVPNPAPSVEQWYGAQSEVALPPRCIPAEMIAVDAADGGSPAERNYRIDPEAAAEFALTAFRDHLG